MSSERLLRTFVAVDLPARVKEVVLELQTLVHAKPKVVKWVKASNIHLTLRFIGPTPEEEVPKINQALTEIAEEHQDISLEISGTGVFPKKQRPRVLWLGVRGEVDRLKNLVGDMNEALKRLGYPPEKRDYSPHITIARIRYPQKVTPDVSAFLNCEYESIAFDVQNAKFFQSELVPGGPIYSILGVHQLRPGFTGD